MEKEYTIIHNSRVKIYPGAVTWEKQHAHDDTVVLHFNISVSPDCPLGLYNIYLYGYPVLLYVYVGRIDIGISDNLETGNYWSLVYFKESNVPSEAIFCNGIDMYDSTRRICKEHAKEDTCKFYGKVVGKYGFQCEDLWMIPL